MARRGVDDLEEVMNSNLYLSQNWDRFTIFDIPGELTEVGSSAFRDMLQKYDERAEELVTSEVWDMMNKTGKIPWNSISNFHEEPYCFLSNFYEAEISYGGLTYGSNEAAYQAQKCMTEEEKLPFTEVRPSRSKGMGRQVKLRPDWEEVKTRIMEEIVRAKFAQHPELARQLLGTGDKVIIEGNRFGDTFWGVDVRTGEGENNLGQILMKVRAELQAAEEEKRSAPYYEPWYSYGRRVGEDARIIWHDPVEGTEKLIVDENGMICNFPGILHPEALAAYYKDDSGKIKPYVHYRTEISQEPEGHILIWELQPDGRYWADEDGFGASDDLEIRLYAKLDARGCFEGPFRIYTIGQTSFYGNDLEELYVAQAAARAKDEEKERGFGRSQEEMIYNMIEKAVDLLIGKADEWPHGVGFPVEATGYTGIVMTEKYYKSGFLLKVGVQLGNASRTAWHYLPYRGSREEILEVLLRAGLRTEVYDSLQELTRS